MSLSTEVPTFDFTEPVPEGRLAIEASAGTGKTFTLAGLVTLFVAEKAVPISEILVVTFTRAATNELRSRVRQRLVDTIDLLEQQSDGDPISARLLGNPHPDHLPRLKSAVADFESATITTIHGFATQVLGTLGVTSGVDPDTSLIDDTDEVTAETCADVLAGHAASVVDADALPKLSSLVKATATILKIPGLEIIPDPSNDELDKRTQMIASLALEAAHRVAARRESSATMSFDDVLVKLRDSLDDSGADAILNTLRQRFSVALIDEFQDTDPIQWQIFHKLFGEPESTTSLVLVGDPKQAIYSFRGADIHTYLDAVHSEGNAVAKRSLTTNWRSDGAMLSALETLLDGVSFGASTIGFSPVSPSPDHASMRIRNTAGDPIPALSIRLAVGDDIERNTRGIVTEPARDAVFNDLVGHINHLLAEGSIPDDSSPGSSRRVTPADIAVLVLRRADAESVRDKLTVSGVPAVLARGSSVLQSEAATHWRFLLYAMARPSDPDRARTFAMSWFGGRSVGWLRGSTDDEIAELQESLSGWADLLADSGLAVAAARIRRETDVTARVLRHLDGDRQITDLDHVAELLHNAYMSGATSPAALLASLDSEPDADADADADTESDGEITSRRVESEAAAVQILTVWVAKGLEFPIVCAPTLWLDPRVPSTYVYHDPETGRRTFDIASSLGGSWSQPPKAWPDKRSTTSRRNIVVRDAAAEHLRLMYVALTRAKHHTAVWWSHPNKSSRAGLSRVLFGRNDPHADLSLTLGESVRLPVDDDLVKALDPLVKRGNGDIEVVVHGAKSPAGAEREPDDSASETKPSELVLAELGRVPDRYANRWSFSAIVNRVEYHPDPHDPSMSDRGAADEQANEGEPSRVSGAGRPNAGSAVSPLSSLPAGASFGTLVHEVLEDIDFTSRDLEGDLRESVTRRTRVGSLDLRPVTPQGATNADGVDLLVDGLATAVRTPLGPLFDGARLDQIARSDRLDEMSFEILLGDGPRRATDREIGALILAHLGPEDQLRGWAQDVADGLFGVDLAGHLTGSIDALIRVTPAVGSPRFVVVDYKSNRLHDPSGPPQPGDYSQDSMAAAMGHHHYGLQALLYSVAVHRYLRWRLPDYDPVINLGGAAYLFARGMAGPEVSVQDGIPDGVFTWSIPPGLVVELSDLLAGGSSA